MSKGTNQCIMTCFIYSLLFVFTTYGSLAGKLEDHFFHVTLKNHVDAVKSDHNEVTKLEDLSKRSENAV